MNETKFYHAENANRVIAGVTFMVYSTGAGTTFGVYKTDDEAQQKLLDDQVANPRSAVTAIDEAEYTVCAQKKIPNYQGSEHSSPVLAPQKEIGSLKGTGAAVATDKPGPEEPPVPVVKEVVETTEDALQTGQVSRPQEQASGETSEQTEASAPAPA